ncbi:hypothetical protein [Streptomyces misionensis]|uniref:hypothetical protein n=1 Tax=Streptomyces misionensis TaxID=67331 RepID=UPI0033B36E38
MSALPHDAYLAAVFDALTEAQLAPEDFWTSSGEENRYDEEGLACMLDAFLGWDGEHPALNTSVHEHGIALIWEHPAEQWLWAPTRRNGHLEREPEFLTALPRWAAPSGVVQVVRELLAGRAAPEEPASLWPQHADAQAAVDAWAEAETNSVEAWKAGGAPKTDGAAK